MAIIQQIHWFPGHMAKARRQMSESLKLVDAAVELVDARLPLASSNPMLHSLLRNKPRVIVMTRPDLADPKQTQAWQQYFAAHKIPVVTVDARQGNGMKKIVPALEQVAHEKRQREEKKGIRPRPLRVLVAGIPNVGKSSLINRLAGRVAARTGDKPGVTKTQQWIRLGDIELLDTPGVLWPKLEDQVAAFKLAVSGAIKSSILDAEELAAFLIVWLSTHYPDAMADRYGIATLEPQQWVDVATAWPSVEPILAAAAKRRGFLQSGGVPDVARAADALLRDVQTGQLGQMSFEWPTEVT